MIRTLHHKPGLLRQIGRSLAFVAVALYALAPAIPAQWMPYYVMLAMPGMAAMADMSEPTHQAMAHQGHGEMALPIPSDAYCPSPGTVAGKAGGAKPAAMDDGGCPICKVAGTVVMITAAPLLPPPRDDAQPQTVFHRWHAPSQRVAAAQPRGPPQQA